MRAYGGDERQGIIAKKVFPHFQICMLLASYELRERVWEKKFLEEHYIKKKLYNFQRKLYKKWYVHNIFCICYCIIIHYFIEKDLQREEKAKDKHRGERKGGVGWEGERRGGSLWWLKNSYDCCIVGLKPFSLFWPSPSLSLVQLYVYFF